MHDAPVCEVLIRIYGDSLSLPRASGGIRYQHTYSEMLAKEIRTRLPLISLSLYNRSGGGLKIAELYERYLHDCSYFGTPTHQALVIQCGIVDCAPRPVPAFLRKLIGKLPGPVRAPITGFLHRARPWFLTVGLSWRMTAPHQFAKVLSRWLEHATSQNARVYVVNIAPTVPSIAAHSPRLKENIVAYNALIAATVAAAPPGSAALIDVHDAITQRGDVTVFVSPSDGHHITGEGNRLYSELILKHELQRLSAGLGSKHD
jgi:hypothetical protein